MTSCVRLHGGRRLVIGLEIVDLADEGTVGGFPLLFIVNLGDVRFISVPIVVEHEQVRECSTVGERNFRALLHEEGVLIVRRFAGRSYEEDPRSSFPFELDFLSVRRMEDAGLDEMHSGLRRGRGFRGGVVIRDDFTESESDLVRENVVGDVEEEIAIIRLDVFEGSRFEFVQA